ncbi:MAG: UDP-N-acetylmuramate dehydrogenase [Flavobacteriaceae bacterium]|nr:UDP-N-acetylmuramate dehydrogenase [Flavobacteriaceae bacterium]
MQVVNNQSLKSYNTFGIEAKAKYFVIVENEKGIKVALELAQKNQWEIFILNGGSNSLFINDFEGLVIKIETKGISYKIENDFAFVTAQAGENWHNFVLFCLDHNFGGLENLSLIPGNVGTSPMQNIGAYGTEIKDSFFSLKALNIQTHEIQEFTNADCEFDYRESFFKNEGKNRFIILEATYKLTTKNHVLNTSYGAIEEELKRQNIENPTIKNISEAVIHIRQTKLPDPKILGNAGSFFKNPYICLAHYQGLKEKFPNTPHYPMNQEVVKIPAGWLIEQCGWKGKRIGNCGVHEKQALVLVNYGGATGREIFELSEKIIADVYEKFSINLQREVNIIY